MFYTLRLRLSPLGRVYALVHPESSRGMVLYVSHEVLLISSPSFKSGSQLTRLVLQFLQVLNRREFPDRTDIDFRESSRLVDHLRLGFVDVKRLF